MPNDNRIRSSAHLALVLLSKGENPFPLVLDQLTLTNRAELFSFLKQDEKSLAVCLSYLQHVQNTQLAAELQA